MCAKCASVMKILILDDVNGKKLEKETRRSGEEREREKKKRDDYDRNI